ncbi:MAG: hypothetical protein ACD_22C00127G0016 [uncultured bacterium]|nr:MAG: hypothetical protein ACD_22C00127G0016 [uncultured bacterium]
MNKYLISTKIASVSRLVKPFSLDGFNFCRYDQQDWDCDAWVATKSIEASNMLDAKRIFFRTLSPHIEKFSAVSQCAFRLFANSYFIFKEDNNTDNLIYIYFCKTTGHVGLMFDDEEIQQVCKLSDSLSNKGFFYLGESTNATTYYTRLTMLIMAVEGFAGENTIKTKNKTIFKINHKALRAILGEDLYKNLYEPGVGLRNVLFHGKLEDHSKFDGLNERIYEKLTLLLSKTYDIAFEENVVHPQRNFHENYVYMHNFWTFKETTILDIHKIEDDLENRHSKNNFLILHPERIIGY